MIKQLNKWRAVSTRVIFCSPLIEMSRHTSLNFSLIKGGNNVFGLKSSELDSHMMKNMEWGAVAYLSASKYGLYNTNGQLLGTFSYLDELINRINYQYRYSFTDDNDKIQKFVNGVKTILVDTEPGVVIKAQTSSDEYDDLHRFIIN